MAFKSLYILYSKELLKIPSCLFVLIIVVCQLFCSGITLDRKLTFSLSFPDHFDTRLPIHYFFDNCNQFIFLPT